MGIGSDRLLGRRLPLSRTHVILSKMLASYSPDFYLTSGAIGAPNS